MSVAQGEPKGAVVLSDTRLSWSNGGVATGFFLSKSEPLAPNVVITYTSSNARATLAGLRAARGSRSVKRIGEVLKQVHCRYGGLSEVLAVVTRKGHPPVILELTHPEYRPRERQGIVGIGDAKVLDWFRNHLDECALPDVPMLDVNVTAEPAEHRSILPPAQFPIEQAAMLLTAAFTEAIRNVGGSGVGLPVQTITVQNGIARSIQIIMSEDLNTFEQITAERNAVRVLGGIPPTTKGSGDKARRAQQLAW